MSQQSESPLTKLKRIDPEFHKAFLTLSYSGTPTPAPLDPKTKSLISLAIHVALGFGEKVKSGDSEKLGVAEIARANGATDDEIKQVVRLAFITRGFPALNTGLGAF